jgi:hypothetical protein
MPMHQLAWPLAGIFLAFGVLHTYRLLRGTVADTLFLAALAIAAMMAGYLFG